jgi:hypothetical protein
MDIRNHRIHTDDRDFSDMEKKSNKYGRAMTTSNDTRKIK